MFVGELLRDAVPGFQADDGGLEIVAIARRPGVLSKVAVRARPGAEATHIGADDVARVSRQLDGERIDLVSWQPSARHYIADALGLAEVPPMTLLPAIGHARVLLGEIDVRGIAGWRGLNVVLASALTGWRIRLEPLATTLAWCRLEEAMRARRAVQASVVGSTERGLRVELLGLYATLSSVRRNVPEGQELQVRVTRMDADEGRIFVSDRLGPDGQLSLI